MKRTSERTDLEIEELVRRHQGTLRGYLSFLGCPADRVDDMLQDVFLSLLSSRFEQRSDAATRAFLRRIARNLFLRWAKRERGRVVPLDPALADRVWIEFEGDDGGAGYMTALRKCLTSVGARASQVLGLRYRDGVRLAVMAQDLGMTEAGVKSILVRTKRKLRECIQGRLAS